MENILPKDCRFSFETRAPAGANACKTDCKVIEFKEPFRVLTLKDSGRLQSFFLELETLSRGYYLAGFFSYEFGYLLEPFTVAEFTAQHEDTSFGCERSRRFP